MTVLRSAASRRFLLTSWPWRALGHVLTTPFVALLAGVPLAVLVAPWAYLVLRFGSHTVPPSLAEVVFLLLLGMVSIGAFGPLLAIPVAHVERARLRLVDSDPVESGHRPPARSWLRTRYAERATWSEFAYLCLLVAVGPVPCAAIVVVLLMVRVTTFGQALAAVALGVLLVYLMAGFAGAHGAVARALLHDGLAEVARSRLRLVHAFEAERRRIERDLHDGAQQRLVSLTLQLGLARLDVPPDSPVAAAHEQAKVLMAELRAFIHGIHPRVLTDRGLTAALHELADRSAFPVEVTGELPRLPGLVEETAYFVAAEALTNTAKHSGATHAQVSVAYVGSLLTLEISDNGHGGADPRQGTGLTGLADRVAVADGRITLSSPVGGPTLLRAELPCRLSG